MRSRLSNKILNGHPDSIIGKTLLLALVFCFVLSGTRSFSTNASQYFSYYVYDRYNQYEVGLENVEYFQSFFDFPTYNFATSLQASIDNVMSWITEYYPNFSWAYSDSGNLIQCLPAGIYSYLENFDVSDPDFYVNICIISPNQDLSNSTLLLEFSKDLVQQTVYTSGSIGTLSFSKYLYVHSNSAYYPLSVFSSPVSISTSYTYSSGGYVASNVSISSQNLVVDIDHFFNGNLSYYNFYQLFDKYYDDNFCSTVAFGSGSDLNAYRSIESNYILPIIIQFSCYALNSNFNVVKYRNAPYIYAYNSSYLSDSPVVQIGGLYSTTTDYNPTPTPIPSFEAYPTPTAFPTIAINNNLTPIPEEWDPGIIWEDITTDDVAGNLQGVMTTITDFISSSVPRFYSEVLTIMYRRSDWFSFLAIIPGLSLIIFLLGRLRRK